jgi:hypothetical protein
MALTKIKTGSVSDSITLTTPDINGGTIDATLIGGTTPAAATFTTASDASGNVRSGRKNLIINGAMQVSQRGNYTSATAASHNNYYLDRWLFESGLSQTIQDTGFKQKVVVTAGGTSIVGIRQKIEDKTYNRLLGKTVTLSAKVTSNSSDARICSYADGWRVGTAHTGGGAEETLTLTYTVPSSLSVAALMLEVAITGSSYLNVAIAVGDYIEITDVQLEVGSVATDFEHRSYGEELALCQRYYENLMTKETLSMLSNAWAYSASQVQAVVRFAVDKRVTPTMGYEVGIAYQGTGETGRTDIIPLFYIPSIKAVLIYASNGVSLTAGQSAYLLNRDNGTGMVFANAEL